MSETLILNGKDLTLENLYSVVYDRRPVQIDPEVIPLVDKSRQVLFDMAADGKPVYGLNHGVGWNKDREFSQDFFEQYNRNLINSHSLGVAPFASVEEVRAMMCIRLNTALCGRTGGAIEELLAVLVLVPIVTRLRDRLKRLGVSALVGRHLGVRVRLNDRHVGRLFVRLKNRGFDDFFVVGVFVHFRFSMRCMASTSISLLVAVPGRPAAAFLRSACLVASSQMLFWKPRPA